MYIEFSLYICEREIQRGTHTHTQRKREKESINSLDFILQILYIYKYEMNK